MADRLVTADASPLIGLAAAGGFDLLRKLFGRLRITDTVRDEVLAGGELPGAAELTEAIRQGWIEVEHTRADAGVLADLDAGESSTLTLAAAHSGPSALRVLESRGVPVSPSLAVRSAELEGVSEHLVDAALECRDEEHFLQLLAARRG